jgi:hypothetical protein
MTTTKQALMMDRPPVIPTPAGFTSRHITQDAAPKINYGTLQSITWEGSTLEPVKPGMRADQPKFTGWRLTVPDRKHAYYFSNAQAEAAHKLLGALYETKGKRDASDLVEIA